MTENRCKTDYQNPNMNMPTKKSAVGIRQLHSTALIPHASSDTQNFPTKTFYHIESEMPDIQAGFRKRSST